MINFINANKFCCEDIRLIENYNKAVNDPEIWDCHHRLESDLGLSRDELKEQNRYFKVPASELIFLTHAEHTSLHKTGIRYSEETNKKRSEKQKKRFEDPNERQKCSLPGEKNPMYGKNAEDYMSPEAIKEKRQKQSESQKKRFEDPKERQKCGLPGEKNPMWGKSRSKESRQKQSKSLKGKFKDRPWMNNGIIRVRPKNQEEIDHYSELGYDFGFKLK